MRRIASPVSRFFAAPRVRIPLSPLCAVTTSKLLPNPCFAGVLRGFPFNGFSGPGVSGFAIGVTESPFLSSLAQAKQETSDPVPGVSSSVPVAWCASVRPGFLGIASQGGVGSTATRRSVVLIVLCTLALQVGDPAQVAEQQRCRVAFSIRDSVTRHDVSLTRFGHRIMQ